VLAQTYPDWEIVIVDDGSTDNTSAVVDSCRPKLRDKLQYIHQPNRGLPAARNTGIRAARGEFIALLDADDVWLPHRLERGVSVMDADPGAGLVHARVVRINAQGTITGQLKVEPKYMSGRIARYIYTRRAHIVCPTVMFRKSCLQTVGWFDETMQATEDRDLWFRIALRYKVVYINDVLAHYRLSPSSMTSNLDRLRKAQLYFVAKHHKSGAATRLDQLQALGNIYRELGDSLFRGGAVTKAIGSYLRAVGYNPLSVPNVYMLFRAIMDPVVRVCVTATR
jgi:glycosyltransferase involved in cell wall biosynthesis